jgi:Kef-type K+ transport system membrane component KefB
MFYLLSATAAYGNIPEIIVSLGAIILLGLLMGRLAESFKIPAITGYLIAGLLLGPIFHFVSHDDLASLSVISDIALGFIAFQVGNELWFGKLKKSGMKIVVITIIQAFLTTALVTLLTSFFVALPVALLLGAIAAATAPAPIMMIIKKYRSKGELTDTVLPVVGLDDAVGVIMFGIILSISTGMLDVSRSGMSFMTMITPPMIELLISIGLGIGLGVIAGLSIRTISHNQDRKEKNLNVVVVTVLLTTGTALYFGASPILTPMIAGTVVTNMINKDCFVLEEETIRFFVPPIMIAFFTIAGAELQFSVVLAAGAIGLMYILGRTLGKLVGSYAGTALVHSSPKVRKLLGITLLPQSGVAIGLSIAAFNQIALYNMEYALIIKNVILAAVLFFELFAPVLVKLAFDKAGESRVEEKAEKHVTRSHVYAHGNS